jgi:hypothetical protein
MSIYLDGYYFWGYVPVIKMFVDGEITEDFIEKYNAFFERDSMPIYQSRKEGVPRFVVIRDGKLAGIGYSDEAYFSIIGINSLSII